MIFGGLSPNNNKKAVGVALRYLLLPLSWRGWRRQGDNTRKVIQWMKDYFSGKYAHVFDSGRSSLYFSLKALGVGEGSEVIVQAYTCVVVINAITWTGATPVYVDIDAGACIDIADFKKKITKKTRAVIVQHTFGRAAKVAEAVDIARKHDIRILEDCAHTIGGVSAGQKLGTFGDVAIFSFGSEKVLSCVRGGAAITNDGEIDKKLREYAGRLPQTDRLLVFQHLAHLPIFYVGRTLYRVVGIGKSTLAFASRLHLVNKIIHAPEKSGKQLQFYPALFPEALAAILSDELEQLTAVNRHRQHIAKRYSEELDDDAVLPAFSSEKNALLDYPIFVKDTEKFFVYMKKRGVLLNPAWSGSVIVPRSVKLDAMRYTEGECPNAERFAASVVLLPNNRNMSDADTDVIIRYVNDYVQGR